MSKYTNFHEMRIVLIGSYNPVGQLFSVTPKPTYISVVRANHKGTSLNKKTSTKMVKAFLVTSKS